MEDAISLCPLLSRNLDIFRDRLGVPQNMDVIIRRFRAGIFEAALLAVDGMVDAKTLNENILKPCMDLPESAGEDIPPSERIAFLMANAVSVLPMKIKDNIDDILSDTLSGQSVLLCEGCAVACVMDTRGFEKRTIGRPEAEKVVLGAHESFSESIRTSITLIRRIVQREELVTEFLSVGGKMKTRCALLYLRGTADEEILSRIRKRLLDCQSDFPLSSGDIEQVIEQHPFALIPQSVRTERPDRAASFLAEGQIIILTDGSPEALSAPATIYHQLHTPDDASMRWQYGSFLRLVRLLGIAIHLFLPGLYLAVLRFHPELLSAMLLTSVYETSSRVPFPVFLEALMMTLAFDLITEAGLRAPGALGSALGIVSGLILGQSAVSADIVSPLLLIVVAASGLGGFCVPNYALSVGLKIVQLAMMTAGAVGGFTAIALLSAALLSALCAMTSLGVPLTSPLSPPRRKNPDILLRLPQRYQKARAFFSQQTTKQAARATRETRIRATMHTRATAAGLCVGAQILALCTGTAMPLSLNAAWMSALFALPACAAFTFLSRRQLVQSLSGKKNGRIFSLLLALSLAACSIVLLSALVNLSGQTFLSQAQMAFPVIVSVLFLTLITLCGKVGAPRAAFFLRRLFLLLPALFLVQTVSSGTFDGLFPIMGTGTTPLLLSALMMTGAGVPALLLALPPDIEGLTEADIPSPGFFLLRVLTGAAAGVALLFFATLQVTYEAIAASLTWGERLRMICGSGNGILFSFKTFCLLVLFLLGAANALIGSAQLLEGAFLPLAKMNSAFLLLLALTCAAMAALMLFGFDIAPILGVLSPLPALIALLWRRKR